jgi:poly-gamma-glutamate capsule biosynthesis protein CapA/YwtB (metallophosphatase superfamily)
MATDDLTLLLAGDALMTRPWSHVADPAFQQLVDEIRGADVAIANLETVIHEFKGFAQHTSGGTWMASPPAIAGELRWAGFDMLTHANNHAFDYGSTGILETIEHVETAGLVLAGSGRDLQDARSPRYVSAKGRRVALISMAVDYVPYGRASNSRSDFSGRPGVNPLTLTKRERAIVIPPQAADRIRALARKLGRKPEKLVDRSFKIGTRFHIGRQFGIERSRRLMEADRKANLDAISEAAGAADIVVASIHAHSQGRWLREFAEDAIEQGADIVFVQGPHEVRGIGFHRGKPIFYCLGDFIYETANVARFPTEMYDRLELGAEATPAELVAVAQQRGWPIPRKRQVFEGLVATISIASDRVARIVLTPIDLQFEATAAQHGRPQVAPPPLGRRIVEEVAARSRSYGVRITYDPAINRGEVELPGLRTTL